MTKSEYQELAEFLAARFDRVDRRFDGIDARLDGIDERLDGIDERLDAHHKRLGGHDKRMDGFDERLRRVEILGEENRHHIKIVAEAVSGLDRKLELFRSEVSAGFQDLRELIRASHLALDERVTRLEEGRRN